MVCPVLCHRKLSLVFLALLGEVTVVVTCRLRVKHARASYVLLVLISDPRLCTPCHVLK